MRRSVIVILLTVAFGLLSVYVELDDSIIGSFISWLGLGKKDPEASMTMVEVISYHGYQVTSYDVQTADGYILTLQNIAGNKTRPCSACGKPVILQHGFLASSATWVINTVEKNLAYILADEGYDVWLSNSRGTSYGRKHVTLDPDEDEEFWNFSWDEMAKYDMPAVIDFILNKTGHKELFYVGHSMGTTIALGMLSSKPEYNARIKAFLALAPVYTRGSMTSPLKYLAAYHSWLKKLGHGELLPHSPIRNRLTGFLCNLAVVRLICSSVFFTMYGFNFAQFNQTRLPVYLQFVPAGTSIRNFIHRAQLVHSGKFQYFDYGPKGNQLHYNQSESLVYDVKKITTPVALFWSDNDKMTHPTDVASLAAKLPNLVLNYRVKHADFTHLDFLWAMDVRPLLYDKVILTLKELWRDETMLSSKNSE